MNRKIDELGRLVIPKEMRKQLGINNNDLVNIECTGDAILITNPNNIDYKSIADKALCYIKDKEVIDLDYLEKILKGE
jgi:AbrB family looped-hinge helix DNA binding protein